MIDDLGYRKAHVIGYSSGAWLAIGIAKYYPDRLSSLLVGGWDVVNGLPQGPDGPFSFDDFMAYARLVAPDLTTWVNSGVELSLRLSFNALGERRGMDDTLRSVGVPKLLWAGRDDLYHEALQAYAAANAIPFLSVTGDHVTAMLQPSANTLEGICSFVRLASISQIS